MTDSTAHHDETDPETTPVQQPTLDEAGENVGLARELVELILTNKKWWLAPVVIVLLVIGVLVAVGSTALAPYLYPLF
ncbi:MAG: hypothetical protein H6814_03870 [Phycisphaeraceae bacterium]|nr:hypothetical protein [Phycisphaeraceae bacterium]